MLTCSVSAKRSLRLKTLTTYRQASPLLSLIPFQKSKSRDILIKSVSRDTPLARKFSERNTGLLRETRFAKMPGFKTDINIYADKVALIDLSNKDPFAVIIESKHIADTLRIIWGEVWKHNGDSMQ